MRDPKQIEKRNDTSPEELEDVKTQVQEVEITLSYLNQKLNLILNEIDLLKTKLS